MRTLVTFRNAQAGGTTPRADLPPPRRQGSALAGRLIALLREAGHATDAKASRDELGWYFYFDGVGGRHCIVLRFQVAGDATMSDWYAWLERERGIVPTLLGLRRHGIAAPAAEAIHAALGRMPEYTDVQWHRQREFRPGQPATGASEPTAP